MTKSQNIFFYKKKKSKKNPLHCWTNHRLAIGADVDGVNVQGLQSELDQADVDQGLLGQELLVLNSCSFCKHKIKILQRILPFRDNSAPIQES